MAAAVTGLERSWSCLQQGKNPGSSANGICLLSLHKLIVLRRKESICKTLGALDPGHLQWVIPPHHSQPLPSTFLAGLGGKGHMHIPLLCTSSHTPISTSIYLRQSP